MSSRGTRLLRTAQAADPLVPCAELGMGTVPISRFATTLECVQKGPFTYRASDDVPFGVRWNSAANYEKGQTLEHFAAYVLRENGSLVTLWEVPFANAHGGRTLSGDDFRALGRDIADALSVYCRQLKPVLK